jgi:hypothetical protein
MSASPQPPVDILPPGPTAYDLPGIAAVGGEGRDAGRGYFAERDFAAGEVVISEDPLVVLPPNAVAVERYMSFASCSAAARGLVLDMSLPNLQNLPAATHLLPGADAPEPSSRHQSEADSADKTVAAWVRQARASVDAALATHPDLASVGADMLVKVHLAWTCNAHSFRPNGTPAGDPPNSALFAIGSKVSRNLLEFIQGEHKFIREFMSYMTTYSDLVRG